MQYFFQALQIWSSEPIGICIAILTLCTLCVVCTWTGGQQSRLPVPTGTPTAGLYHPALFARPHLDRHPAYLYPWVLVHHSLSLYLFITLSVFVFHFLFSHLVTVCLHCWLVRHFFSPQPSLFPSLLVSVLTQHNFSHSPNPATTFDLSVDCSLLNQVAIPVILRKLFIVITVILSELPEVSNNTKL